MVEVEAAWVAFQEVERVMKPCSPIRAAAWPLRCFRGVPEAKDTNPFFLQG